MGRRHARSLPWPPATNLAARLAADSANTPLACAASTFTVSSTAADSWSSGLHVLEASDFGIDAVEGGVDAREKVLAEIRGMPSHLDSARAALLAARSGGSQAMRTLARVQRCDLGELWQKVCNFDSDYG